MKKEEGKGMISMNSVVAAAKEQISSDLGGEVAILHLKRGIYYSLNEVGARIWALIQEPRPVHQVQAALMAEYDVEADCCQADLLALLEQLAAEKLILIENGTSA